MAARCFQPVFGKRLRVVVLDECGNPPASGTADSMAVTDGFISVSLKVTDSTHFWRKFRGSGHD